MNWHPAEPAPALVAHPVAASLDEAHAAIELWEFYSRKVLDSAQRLAVELMMAEGADGLWAASSTGRAESRQNGKGDEIEVPELWGLTQRGEAILHTAHEAATAAAAHVRLRELLLGHRDLRAKLGRNRRGQEAIQSWNGNYRIEMDDGAFIVHRTRTAAIGRGLDDISRLVVDEAQHAQPEELASATPILAANPNPQKNYIGSAGIVGRSVFWWRLRCQALLDDPGRFSWLEHSAEEVWVDSEGLAKFKIAGDVADRDLWRRANPAYPSRISDDFLAGQLRDLGPEHYAREHLCVWDPQAGVTSGWMVIEKEAWGRCFDPLSGPTGEPAFALDLSPNRDALAFAVAGESGRGGVHIELVSHGPNPGNEWIVAESKRLQDEHGGTLAVVAGSPAASLQADLEAGGVRLHVLPYTEYVQACGDFFDAVAGPDLFHLDQDQLNAAVEGAERRWSGDAWSWARRTSIEDITPLVAVTTARWVHLHAPVDAALSVW